MKIGIGMPNPVKGAHGRALVEWAQRAEAAGFSTLATIGRVAYPSYDDLMTLAAAAGATQRIGLLTNILLGGTRNPVLLAKQAASLDRLSGGRFTLGIGVGGRQDDFAVSGTGWSNRGRRLDQDLERMHALWRGEIPKGTTERVTPTPENGTAVPLLIGGGSDKAIERSLRYGQGWTASGGPPEQVGPFAERVRAAWHAAGKGEPRIVAFAYFAVGSDEASKAYLRDYYAFLGPWVDRIAEGAARTPDAIRAQVKAFEDVGADELILDPTVADPEQVDRLAAIVL